MHIRIFRSSLRIWILSNFLGNTKKKKKKQTITKEKEQRQMISKTCFKGWVWLFSQSFAWKQELCTKQILMFLTSKFCSRQKMVQQVQIITFSFHRKVNMRIQFSSVIKQDLKESVWLCRHKQFFVLRKKNWKCDWFLEIRLNLFSKFKHFIWTKISFLIYILQIIWKKKSC